MEEIEGAEVFGEKFFLECVKQGVLKAKKVFCIADERVGFLDRRRVISQRRMEF